MRLYNPSVSLVAYPCWHTWSGIACPARLNEVDAAQPKRAPHAPLAHGRYEMRDCWKATTSLPDAPTMKLIGPPARLFLARSRSPDRQHLRPWFIGQQRAKGRHHFRTLGPRS
jgi:hypothetical protein